MSLRSLLKLLSPPRATLALSLLLLCASSTLNLVQPWIAGQVTALITGSAKPLLPGLFTAAAAWGLAIISRSVISFFSSYQIGMAAEEVLARLRSHLYEHLQLLPLPYFDDRKRGDVLSILTNDAAAVSNFVTGTLVRLLPTLVTFFGAAFMMCWLNLKIGLITLAVLPLFFLIMRLVGRRIRPLSRQWVDTYGQMVAHAEENIGMLPAIKSFTREIEEAARFTSTNNRLLSLSKRQLLIFTMMPSLTSLLAGLGLLALVAVGYSEIQAGKLNTADLVSLLFFAVLMNQPVGQLAGVYGELQRVRGASERILAFLDEQKEPQETEGKPIDIRQGAIEFRRVSFAYSANQRPVLCDLNLTIAPAETVAIVGQNGAGKTTLVHLLLRLIEPGRGNICIDDIDIKNVNLRSLRSQIGLVAQHTLLLNGSVSENIGWGKALASQEQIEAAARSAHAHDFISDLPNGYETIVGDQGLKLSGGQRQRLSLARALLKNPPILILDEATSMFDPAGEADFLKACKGLFADRTVLLITHRPASLAIADRVFSLKDGKLSEVGDVGRYLITGESEK